MTRERAEELKALFTDPAALVVVAPLVEELADLEDRIQALVGAKTNGTLTVILMDLVYHVGKGCAGVEVLCHGVHNVLIDSCARAGKHNHRNRKNQKQCDNKKHIDSMPGGGLGTAYPVLFEIAHYLLSFLMIVTSGYMLEPMGR